MPIRPCIEIPPLFGAENRRQAVAAHHLADAGTVGRPASRVREDRADLAEVGRAEDARAGDRQETYVLGAAVGEAVDRAARDTQRLAGADLDRFAVHGV